MITVLTLYNVLNNMFTGKPFFERNHCIYDTTRGPNDLITSRGPNDLITCRGPNDPINLLRRKRRGGGGMGTL